LEKEIQARWALGHSADQAMASLAGLREIKYVLVYPDTGDLVLAGPAGDWTVDAEGRQVSVFDGKPILQLDDLVVLMRSALHGDGRFGCSISPKQEHLARTQEYLAETSQRPLRAGTRTRWLGGLREALGNQDVSVYGVDPRTRVARVIVEADYHMKLVGMGLEPGVLGVTSYLNLIEVEPGQAPPPLDVLRWWFTLNYDAIATNSGHNAFQFRGQGVQVLSENQLLTQQGQQIPTGKSDALNHQFAHSFTEHFAELAEKYPVYAQLKNIFDLALVGALVRQEDLHTQVGWQLAHFLEPDKYHVALERVPREVPSVVNHRVINRKHVIAGVSGGITADPQSFVRPASIQVVTQSTEFDADYQRSSPDTRWQVGGSWWWD
jgi:hypothetical protein